ncbi:hypothetical protein BOX15_Mlig007336g1 [Macrostomum lignano]|uniref:Uncharacterized protein n=2 Tax=Macrostomum lignano TaxID=282301 RepID=A0A267H4F0_9PLAT|nr:hypothetical protein BOX15_Mlig007336g2 [Macrostomum lignano]PAA93158.1 hypothetical protein BOX15_Mlig007336g1 [Macrostomum lignano]
MLHLLTIATLALALSGPAHGNVILANQQMDTLLQSLTQNLRDTNTHMVSVLDKKVGFSKKVGFIRIKGSASINGQLGDLSTVRRAGDASLSQSGTVLTLQGLFGANVGGTLRARVSWSGIKVTASIKATLKNFRAFLRVTHDLGVSGASPVLREVRLHSLGSLSVSIGGLGALDWVLSPISKAMSGIISEVMNGWISNQLAAALRRVVKLIRLG